MKVVFSRLVPSLVALVFASPAFAQRAEVLMPGGVVPAGTMAPASSSDVLAINLRVLAANPRDVNALTQAGISALAVGDPNAALGFFARAEQISPTNGRVKAGLGSAMVMMERPSDAMPLFAQAVSFGVPEQIFAKDRGLARDLLGDPRNAQRDYALALRSGPDAETTRRLALSMGISGERDQALRLLEPLIRQQDQGAWRARAFILALSGDQRGAERIVQQVMPAGMGSTMAVFLNKLPALGLSARAAAVHFGTMPNSGPSYAALAPAEAMRAIPGSMTDMLTREDVAKPSFVADIDKSRRKTEKEKRRRPGRDSNDDGRMARAAKSSDGPIDVSLNASLPVPNARPPVIASNSAPRRIEPVAMARPPVNPFPPAFSPASRPSAPAVEAPLAPVFEISSTPARLATPAAPIQAPSAGGQTPVAARVESPLPTQPTIKPAVAPAPKFVPPIAPVLAAAGIPSPATPPAAVAITAPVPAPVPVPVLAAAPVPARIAAPAPVPVSTASSPAAPPPPTLMSAAPPSPVSSAPSANRDVPQPSFSEAVQAFRSPAPATAPQPAPPPATVQVAPPQPSLMGPPAPQAPVASPSPAPAQPLAASVAGDVITAAPESVTNTALAEPQGQGLLGLLEALSPEEEKPAVASVVGDDAFRKARLAARKKADDDAKAKIVAETKSKLDAEAKLRKAEDDAKKAEARRNPERVWVQVATGSAKSGIGITVKRVREQAGDALKGAGAASVPYRATNRILMGPYASEGEARRVVNALAKKGVQATTFTSTAGQEIAKLSSK